MLIMVSVFIRLSTQHFKKSLLYNESHKTVKRCKTAIGLLIHASYQNYNVRYLRERILYCPCRKRKNQTAL